MITTHKNNLIQRCNERGYTLEEVMPCVSKQDGDIWTIDETHEKYPKEKIGAGTELKKLLKLMGIVASPNCSCNAKAKTMDENGLEWCKDNIDTIVSWLKEEADKRHLPFLTYGAKRLVKFAIGKAEKRLVNNANTI